MTAEKYLDMVKSRLDEKPTQVAWHLVYQDTMQRDEPEYDLRQEYRTRLQDQRRDSALLYLLARTTLRPTPRLDLLARAINARPAVSYAYHGIALEHLANGRFKDGIAQLRKALELSPDNESFRETQRDLFVADGQYEFALAKYREAKGSSIVTQLNLLASRLSLLVAMGEAETAQQEIVQVMRDAGAEYRQEVVDLIGNTFKEKLAYGRQDWQSYRSLHPDPSAENSPFHVLVTLGRYQDASTRLDDESTEEEYDGLESRAADHLLLYIAGTDIGDSELASKHLAKATELLNKTGVHGQMVARALTTGQANLTTLIAYPAPPSVKRIVMVACAKRFPAEADAYASMAKKLNFELTFPRWFLESAR